MEFQKAKFQPLKIVRVIAEGDFLVPYRGIMNKPHLDAVRLPFSFRESVLAAGSDIKNSFAVLIGGTVFISGVSDDLREAQTFENYRRDIVEICKLKLKSGSPDVVACDMHPEYISSKCTREIFEKANSPRRKPKFFEVQHHHAHIASCMAENGLAGRVIGVAFDGTGYGPDGNIWGGEFLAADYHSFQRKAHFANVPMPGLDKAVLEPARMAFSYLYSTYKRDANRLKLGVLKRIGKDKCRFFAEMIDKNINSPRTSSAGRLFDAVSSLIGVKDRISYEGEAAIELEKIAFSDCSEIYEFAVKKIGKIKIVEFWPMIKAIVRDLEKKVPPGVISRKFHNTQAEAIKRVSSMIRRETKLNNIVLSGGVFQNRILLGETKKRLEDSGFSVYIHSRTSCTDKSLSLGQAVIAASRVESREILATRYFY